MRLDNLPEIEIKILDRPEHPFPGAREATAMPKAASITNSVKDTTGLRLGRIPFKEENIRQMVMSEQVMVKEVCNQNLQTAGNPV